MCEDLCTTYEDVCTFGCDMSTNHGEYVGRLTMSVRFVNIAVRVEEMPIRTFTTQYDCVRFDTELHDLRGFCTIPVGCQYDTSIMFPKC